MAPSDSLPSPESAIAIYYYSCLFSDMSVLNMKSTYYLLPVANEVSDRLA